MLNDVLFHTVLHVVNAGACNLEPLARTVLYEPVQPGDGRLP